MRLKREHHESYLTTTSHPLTNPHQYNIEEDLKTLSELSELSDVMAAWDTSYPPPRTSSRMPTPGIFVNVEFGVSFNTQKEKAHLGGFKFGSRNVQSKIQRKREEQFRQQRLQRQQQEELFFETTPTSLMPGNGFYMQEQPRSQEQERPQRLTVRTQYERGSSAPPTLSDRHIPLSPIGSISPMSPVSPIGTIQHTLSMPLEGYERPLPSVPALFRLGEDGLPWSTEPFYLPQSPDCVRASMVDIDLDNGRGEDPQRVRELESLQQAMMTVDTLPNDGWEPWTWDSVGDMPRGPRSIGWAVRSERSETTRSTPISPPPPPPYVVSQWEEAYDRYDLLRPRSSG